MIKIIKRFNNHNQGDEKEIIITGYWVSKWCGFLYDQSWTSVIHITRLILFLILTILHILIAVLLYEDMSLLEKVLITNYAIVYINCLFMVLPLIYNSKKNQLLCSIIKTEFQEAKIQFSPKQLEVKKYTKRFVRNFAYNVAFYLYGSLIINFIRRYLFEGVSLKILPVNGWVPFELNSLIRYTFVFIFQIVASISGMSAHVGFLIIFVTHSVSLCEQFEILSIHIHETFKHVYFGETMECFEVYILYILYFICLKNTIFVA
ncbi:uncharacterized protein isoform X1 [Rhodnius prolixus]|uniref:uncharacterized protein isoform X1 n=1 Tax=Rhodnius prolixus TaxID=13249 RepID=UPI003D189426